VGSAQATFPHESKKFRSFHSCWGLDRNQGAKTTGDRVRSPFAVHMWAVDRPHRRRWGILSPLNSPKSGFLSPQPQLLEHPTGCRPFRWRRLEHPTVAPPFRRQLLARWGLCPALRKLLVVGAPCWRRLRQPLRWARSESRSQRRGRSPRPSRAACGSCRRSRRAGRRRSAVRR
jgi:hypothetical protein